MKKLLVLSLVFILGACDSSSDSKKDDVIFFQLKPFFEKELEDIKKTPYFIYKIQVEDDKRDSSIIPSDSVPFFAQPFVDSDINDPAIKKFYEESVFHDQTTGSFSLSYSTGNKEQEVQNVNVLLEEDGETVKRIFIRRYLARNDSSIIEQLSWKPNQSFEINRHIQLPNNRENTQRTIIVWNEK